MDERGNLLYLFKIERRKIGMEMSLFEEYMVVLCDRERYKSETWWFFLKRLDGSGKKVVSVNNYEFMDMVFEEFAAEDKRKAWNEVIHLDEGLTAMDFFKHLAYHYYCAIHNAVAEVRPNLKYKRKGELARI